MRLSHVLVLACISRWWQLKWSLNVQVSNVHERTLQHFQQASVTHVRRKITIRKSRCLALVFLTWSLQYSIMLWTPWVQLLKHLREWDGIVCGVWVKASNPSTPSEKCWMTICKTFTHNICLMNTSEDHYMHPKNLEHSSAWIYWWFVSHIRFCLTMLMSTYNTCSHSFPAFHVHSKFNNFGLLPVVMERRTTVHLF